MRAITFIKRYILIWLFLLVGLLFAYFLLISCKEFLYEPLFWIGLIAWGAFGFWYANLIIWVRKRSNTLLLVLGLAMVLFGRFGMQGQLGMFEPFGVATSAWVIALVARVYYEILYVQRKHDRTPMRKRTGKIRVSERGRDQPWPGSWIYRLRGPIPRSFIRGFNCDMNLLSRIAQALTDGKGLVFYCPFDPPNSEPSVFEKTVRYAEEHQVLHEPFIEKHGRIKRLFSGEDESIGAISLDCSSTRVLEWILKHYWTGDFCCWFLAHEGDSRSASRRMRQVLNPETFPQGFKELVLDSHVFMRDVEEGEALELITANLTREEIEQRIPARSPNQSNAKSCG